MGLEINDLRLIVKDFDLENECDEGIKFHDWYVFYGKINGELQVSKEEARNWQWVPKNKLTKLDLEPIWEQWFKKLGVL